MGISAIVLAGGEGKRMKSNKPKALSLVLDKPMLRWVLDSVTGAGIDSICVLTGFAKEYIEEYLAEYKGETGITTDTAVQTERKGTGHAVMMCSEFLNAHPGDIVILNGDAPFIDVKTIKDSYALHKANASAATVISAKVDDPFGYGRIIRLSDGSVERIVEQKDATEEQAKVNEVNSGCYWFDTAALLGALNELTDNNASGEYYLTDTLGILISQGKTVCAYTAESPNVVLGANDPAQLQQLNDIARTASASCTHT